MKKEDCINQLLADMLKKQDQHSELIDSGFKKMLGTLDKHTLLFEMMIGKLDILTEHDKRLTRLESKVFK